MNRIEEANSPLHDGGEAEWYRSIFNTLLDALLILDQEGKITALNPAVENLFGYPSSELIGQSINLLMPNLLPDQPRGFNLLSSSVGLDLEHTGLTMDGSNFPLPLSLSEFSYGGEFVHVVLVRDDTANKMAEEMFQESLKETIDDLERQKEETEKRRSQIRAIVDTSDDAIALVAPDGKFLDIDAQFTEFFEISEDQIKNSNWSDMIPHVVHINEISVQPFAGEKMTGAAHAPMLYAEDPRTDLPSRLEEFVQVSIAGTDEVIVNGWMEN